MELHVSVDSLDSFSRPAQIELRSQSYFINEAVKWQYIYTYFYMVVSRFFLPANTIGDTQKVLVDS